MDRVLPVVLLLVLAGLLTGWYEVTNLRRGPRPGRIPRHMRKRHGMRNWTPETFAAVYPGRTPWQVHKADHDAPDSDYALDHTHRHRTGR
jgi:hypothetical protein